VRGMAEAIMLAASLVAAPVAAQEAAAGRVTSSSVGDVGQRRAKAVAGVAPLARVNTRLQNRIEARLRTRVDRNQAPVMDSSSGYDVAARVISQTDSPR
jgi:hypothetical protein